MRAVSLRNEFLQAQVLPHVGGGLARLDQLVNGQARQVLRAVALPPGSPAPTPGQLACFPLVPWSNRIGGAGFAFDGRTIALQPNRAGEPCPIHGEGWQQAWVVATQTATSVQLVLDRSTGNPFSYAADLTYALIGSALEVTLGVRNCGADVLPFGLGLHPWLPRSEGVQLRARAAGVWQRGDDGLPVAPVAIPDDWDFTGARKLPERAIDNVFTGWDGQADILWPETGTTLHITADMAYYIVYTRPGADFFCFEPVDHMINAHNLPGGPARHGLTLLASGQVLSRTVSFAVGTA